MKPGWIFLALVGFARMTPLVNAASFAVLTTADSGALSLRQAILDANAAGGSNTVIFGFTGSITLASALPAITTNLTIEGPGANFLTISGNNAVRIFTVSAGAAARIS